MSDLISRQEAINAFDCTNDLIVGGEANARNVVNYINKVVGKIKDLPSAQPDDEAANYWHEKANSYEQTLVKLAQSRVEQPERKKGRWISADAIFHGVPFYCSECGEVTRDTVMEKPRWNYCPNCGADMRT